MLIEQLKIERMEAMKLKNTIPVEDFNIHEVKMNLLSTLIGDATKKVKDPVDSDVVDVVKSFIKNIASFITECRDKDIALSFKVLEKFQAELEILYSYLPPQLTERDIESIIIRLIAEATLCNEKVDLKKVMACFKAEYAGQYDGKLVSDTAKVLL